MHRSGDPADDMFACIFEVTYVYCIGDALRYPPVEILALLEMALAPGEIVEACPEFFLD